jgi:hypothetical protein
MRSNLPEIRAQGVLKEVNGCRCQTAPSNVNAGKRGGACHDAASPSKQDFPADQGCPTVGGAYPSSAHRVRVDAIRDASRGNRRTRVFAYGEWRVMLPNGEAHWHFGRARVFKDSAGKCLRVVGAIVDVTERKRAALEILRINTELEERVERRTEELELANKELGRSPIRYRTICGRRFRESMDGVWRCWRTMAAAWTMERSNTCTGFVPKRNGWAI